MLIVKLFAERDCTRICRKGLYAYLQKGTVRVFQVAPSYAKIHKGTHQTFIWSILWKIL